MWADSRKARWSLLAMWAGLAVLLIAAEGLSGAGAEDLESARADATATPCVSEVDAVTRMARLGPPGAETAD
jgi:hypothetical protein